MKMGNRFRFKLFIIMILFAAAMVFLIAIIDYQRITEITIEENEFQMKQTQDTIAYTLQTIDKVYYHFDRETALQMEESADDLLALYIDNPSVENWNLDALSYEIGMDIHILNKDNEVITSNVKSDIGLNLNECCDKIVPVLDERRKTGGFFHDGLDTEPSTGDIKKFGYMATPDSKYLIGLGYSLEEGPIFKEFNIFDVLEELTEDYPTIYDINVLTLSGLSLGKTEEEWSLTPDRKEAFENTFRTKEITEVDSEWGGQSAIYRYFPFESNYDEGEITQTKVVELVYKGDQLEEVLKSNQQTLVIQLLIVLVLTALIAFIVSSWMSRPMYLAFHDSLTGLKNRSGYKNDLEKVLEKNRGDTVVYMVDLDNFKLVNDQLGHDRGDDLLRLTANVINKSVPKNAIVYRLGGDEFSVVIPHVTKEKAEKIAGSMVKNLKQAFDNERDLNGLRVSASIGFILAPEKSTNVVDLYKKADLALYKSKRAGKNQYHMYESEFIKEPG